jgi:hypothetical protein
MSLTRWLKLLALPGLVAIGAAVALFVAVPAFAATPSPSPSAPGSSTQHSCPGM